MGLFYSKDPYSNTLGLLCIFVHTECVALSILLYVSKVTNTIPDQMRVIAIYCGDGTIGNFLLESFLFIFQYCVLLNLSFPIFLLFFVFILAIFFCFFLLSSH